MIGLERAHRASEAIHGGEENTEEENRDTNFWWMAKTSLDMPSFGSL